jgi:hypothetical protein
MISHCANSEETTMSVTETTEAVEPHRSAAGVDWASTDHAVAIVDPDDLHVGRFSVAHDAAGLRTLIRRLLDIKVVEVGIERPVGPIVDVLRAAGLTVYVMPGN